MNPKQKAKQLVDSFIPITNHRMYSNKYAKLSALLCVNGIISANPHSNPFNTDVYSTMDYWLEVKREIENL
jgi:hypothetical protein